MNKTHIIIAAAALALAGFGLAARPAQAADNVQTSASFTVTTVKDVVIKTGDLAFGNVTFQNFEDGNTSSKMLTLTVKSNATWTLKVKGSAANFVSSSKTVGDIQFSTNGTSFTDLTQADQNLYQNQTATSVEGVDKDVYFRVELDFATDTPATYTYNYVVFTVS